ncbi:hypothetical protein M758_6G156500, partial [Ceratodon purpureus]
CLTEWWELMAWKRRANQLDALLAQRLRRTLLQSSLHNWMYTTFDGLLVANAKFQDDLIQAQSQCKEQKHQVSSVDVENLQLIDRLHNMSSEIAYLKTTVNERTQEMNELHRALEDAAMVESSMRDEIEQQHCRIEDLQNDNVNLQRRIQTKNVEDTAGEVHHTLELQNMEQNLQQLRIQLAERTSQLDSYEKALKETAERLEGTSDESQEKLTSAFEIAGSLRKLLEDREHQYASLEGSSRRRELELGEVQRKLASANCTLCETVEARDSRIEELENILVQKQAEIADSQSQLQDLEVALDAKESHVRKLEYEIRLMCEPHGVKASKFVSSLSSYAPTPNRTRGHSHFQGSPQQFHQHVPQQTSMSVPHSPSRKQSCLQVPTLSRPHVRQSQNNILTGSPRLQSIQVQESLRDTYAQTKQALQNSGESPNDVDGMGFRASTSEVQSPRDPSGSTSRVLHSSVLGAQRMETCIPTECPPMSVGGQGGDSTIRSDGSMVRVSDDQSAVDSLHFEIQRLQARIMSRLREPPTPGSMVYGSSQERLPDDNDQRPTNGDPTASTSRGTSPGY